MAGKKGGRVPRPPKPGSWTFRYLRNNLADDWEKLCNQMSEAAERSWDRITSEPRKRDDRGKRLQGDLGSKIVDGKELERWQYEMTSGGRLFYLIDDDRKTVWLEEVHFGHPKKTEGRRR